MYIGFSHHIGCSADGRLYIRQKRGKTKGEAFVALHPIAEQILMLYYTTDNEKPVFFTQGEYEKEYNYNQ